MTMAAVQLQSTLWYTTVGKASPHPAPVLGQCRRPSVKPPLPAETLVAARSWTRQKKKKKHNSICAALTDSSSRNEELKNAAKAGDLPLLQSLLASKDVQVNLPSESRAGWTALHLASFYEQPEVVEILLKAGASTEIRNESGNTALQLACLKGNIPIAKMLLEHGADIRAESNDKGTVVDYAMEWGGEEMVEFLYTWASSTEML